MSTFKEVNRGNPCPICGKTDWCSMSEDESVYCCRRIEKPGGIAKVDRSGMPYWLYFETGRNSKSSSLPIAKGAVILRADSDTLNRVYQKLLHRFPLISKHRQNLMERGLSEKEIEQRGYGSLGTHKRWEKAQDLVEELGEDVCRQVPGFIQKEGDYGVYWTLSGMPGILVPVRDIQKRIIALKIRLDEPTESGKYRYLSSKSHGGAGAGTHVHVPLFTGVVRDVLQVTEGELKADIATVFQKSLTLSIPGVSTWRMVFPILEQFHPKTISIAFDADCRSNYTVANCLQQFADEVRSQGYEIQLVQ
jgi:hypothetical protein